MKRGFAGIHPVVQLLYYCGLMVFCTVVRHPVYLLILLLMIVGNNLVQDRGRRMLGYLPLYLISGAALMILTPLTSHRGATILTYFLDNPITLEAILYGVASGLSVMALLLACTSFQLAVDADGLLYLLARILPNTAMVILIALRFVPHFKIRLREISEVQTTRPRKEQTGRYARIQNAMRVCNILLSLALEDAVFTAQSMRTRGYHLTRKRTFYFPYRMGRQSKTALLFVSVLLLTAVGVGTAGAFDATLYPRIALGSMTAIRIAGAVILAAFTAIPMILGGICHGAN